MPCAPKGMDPVAEKCAYVQLYGSVQNRGLDIFPNGILHRKHPKACQRSKMHLATTNHRLDFGQWCSNHTQSSIPASSIQDNLYNGFHHVVQPSFAHLMSLPLLSLASPFPLLCINRPSSHQVSASPCLAWFHLI